MQDDNIILDEYLHNVCRWIIYAGLCQPICAFGIGTNIINGVIFVRQGFSDPVNVSLLGLTMSDMGCLLTMIVMNIFIMPNFLYADIPFDASALCYLAGGIPHIALTRITGWFTALITLERCLCITMPLKVKQIVTSRRMAILFICVFLILIISIAPLYVVNRSTMIYVPARNTSILGMFYTDDWETVERFSFAVNNVVLPFSAFVIIIVCTAILVVKLHRNAKWRTMSTSAAQSNNISNRNKKIAKMVVTISTLFIICFIPISITFIGVCLFPEFSLKGKYRDLLYIISGLGFCLETINSSVNSFIYYHMSSKYRHIFHQIFNMGNVNIIE